MSDRRKQEIEFMDTKFQDSEVIPTAQVVQTAVKAEIAPDKLHSGIKSCDPALKDKSVLKEFFRYQSRPHTSVVIQGFHHTVRVNHRGTPRLEEVVDFEYRIDITKFLSLNGNIMVKGKQDQDSSFEDILDRFTEDRNKLRSIQMQKEIGWTETEQEHFIKSVEAYISYLGWNSNVRVNFEIETKSVRVHSGSSITKVYDSRFGRIAMSLTVVPMVALALYGSGHRERSVKLVFDMPNVDQVFAAIEEQLWCPIKK